VDLQLAIAFGSVDKSEKRAAKELLDEDELIDYKVTPDYDGEPIDDPDTETKPKKGKKKKKDIEDINDGTSNTISPSEKLIEE